MATPRVGTLPQADRAAIFDAARKLKLNPYELGGFLSLESGTNMDPNIRGGAGGNYYGMIQFGPDEQKKYLDQSRMGKYTRAEQMPKAVQFLTDRGYKPGMGIDRAYATVLGGNPNVSLNAKDSFGTSVAGASKRFKQGGDLYENAKRVLGDQPNVSTTTATSFPVVAPGKQQLSVEDILSSSLSGTQKPDLEATNNKATSLLDAVKQSLLGSLLPGLVPPTTTPAPNPFLNSLGMF